MGLIYLKVTSICANNPISKNFKPEESKVTKKEEMAVFDENKAKQNQKNRGP